MSASYFEDLYQKGLISESSMNKIRASRNNKTLSLYWDIRIVLYAGVLLLSGGLGVLVYKNMEDIGHTVIILFISLACVASYVYSFRKAPPFSWKEVRANDTIFDYVALLASLLMVTLIGYSQYQYKLFGTQWELASFIPLVILFFTAYYFDHQGLLSLAIVNLAAWLGITINGSFIRGLTNLNEKTTLVTAALLGVALILMAYYTRTSGRKSHFHKLYHQFGTHLYFLSAFIGLFVFRSIYLVWVLVFAVGIAYHYWKAWAERSSYYIVVAVLYGYGCLSYVVIDLMDKLPGDFVSERMIFSYFTVSAILLIVLLLSVHRKFRNNAGIR